MFHVFADFFTSKNTSCNLYSFSLLNESVQFWLFYKIRKYQSLIVFHKGLSVLSNRGRIIASWTGTTGWIFAIFALTSQADYNYNFPLIFCQSTKWIIDFMLRLKATSLRPSKPETPTMWSISTLYRGAEIYIQTTDSGFTRSSQFTQQRGLRFLFDRSRRSESVKCVCAACRTVDVTYSVSS